ncbi:hypothetical protein ACVWYZ_002303 [Thermostichus sp. MS-CIW-37]
MLPTDPQEVQRLRVSGLGLQHLLVKRDGLWPLPRLVMANGLGQQTLQMLSFALSSSAWAKAFPRSRHGWQCAPRAGGS